jgi:cob(I)alamin adenosyltransferase
MEINLQNIVKDLHKVTDVINSLNTNMATELEKIKSQLSETELKDLEKTQSELNEVLNKITKHGN